MTHLDKPTHELVLHAAQYFAVLAEQRLTALACASSHAVMTGLFGVLDPDRVMPLECRIASAQALAILTCLGSFPEIGKRTLIESAGDIYNVRLRVQFWMAGVLYPCVIDKAYLTRYLYVFAARACATCTCLFLFAFAQIEAAPVIAVF